MSGIACGLPCDACPAAARCGRTPTFCCRGGGAGCRDPHKRLAGRARRTLKGASATGRCPVDSALHRRVSERFIEACTGGDLGGLLALLDPNVEGAGDTNPEVVVGAAAVALGVLAAAAIPG